MNTEATPILPHLSAEFLLWLWWASETHGGRFDLGGDVGIVDIWVDDKLAFRPPGADKATALFTGENPSASLEARAALLGGKVLHELRLMFRRDDREYAFALRGPALDVSGLKVPKLDHETTETALLDRLSRLEEFHFVITALFSAFAQQRGQATWASEAFPAIQAWANATSDQG